MGELSDLVEIRFEEAKGLKKPLGQLRGSNGRYALDVMACFYEEKKGITPLVLDNFSLLYIAEVRRTLKKDTENLSVDLEKKSVYFGESEALIISCNGSRLTAKSDKTIYNPPYSMIEDTLRNCIKEFNSGLKSHNSQ